MPRTSLEAPPFLNACPNDDDYSSRAPMTCLLTRRRLVQVYTLYARAQGCFVIFEAKQGQYTLNCYIGIRKGRSALTHRLKGCETLSLVLLRSKLSADK